MRDNVWILTVTFDYDHESVLGVFATEIDAKSSMVDHILSSNGLFSATDYSISEWEVKGA